MHHLHWDSYCCLPQIAFWYHERATSCSGATVNIVVWFSAVITELLGQRFDCLVCT